MKQENYQYKNMPIPGGGYVTGFVYSDNVPDLLYMRTDIGGSYRYEKETDSWKSLIDNVTMDDISETFPSAIALDPQDENRLYITSGINKKARGVLSISTDRGEHFKKVKLPFMVHGNLNGRGTGRRLIVNNQNSNELFYASQENGLWHSPDQGNSWEKLLAMPEDYLTFVAQTQNAGALIVGSAGVTTKRSDKLRGYGLYISYDNGKTFDVIWQPRDSEVPGIRLAGLVPQRYSEDEKYFYVTFSVMGYNAYVLENGYSCDGGSVVGGKIVRYPKLVDGHLGQGIDITPVGLEKYIDSNGILNFGFAGITTGKSKAGLLAVSSLCKEDGDSIWRSLDYGNTWECVLYGLEIGKMDFRAHYMRPEYNGGKNLIHWLSDVEINPFNENELWFNTGTGAFRTRNLLADCVVFQDWCDGLEETVHLNLYSPPSGDVKLIDILGDLGGFAFTRLDEGPDNSFADENNNRYITCLNADYSDINPNLVLVTPRGNWTGKTKGGLILSKDQCKTFRRLPMPFGLSRKIDNRLKHLERPNVNSGWGAISPSGNSIVWSIASGNNLPADTVVVSQDGGETFQRVEIYDISGNSISHKMKDKRSHRFKAFSDRVCDDIFYAFGEKGRFYVSLDAGIHFYEKALPKDFPKVEMGLVDCANKTEIRGEAGKSGVFYMALGKPGLWKLEYNKASKKVRVKKLSKDGDIFYRLGLGVGAPGEDYISSNKAIYTAAKIDGEYGFYRSRDDGKSFVRINTKQQMFGEVNSIEGDSQVYGRFYIGTGSRGVLYGEPIGQD